MAHWADNRARLWRPDRHPAGPISVRTAITSSATASRSAARGRILVTNQAVRDIIATGHLHRVPRGRRSACGCVAEAGHARPSAPEVETSAFGRPAREEGLSAMAKTDANPPMPAFPGEYVLQEVAPDDLGKSVKPKQFLHIDQSECIMCEGCVDICPWKCIHMLVDRHGRRGGQHRAARRRPRRPRGLRRRRGRLHPVRPLRRPLPDRRDHHGQGRRRRPRRRHATSATTSTATPTACGSRTTRGAQARRAATGTATATVHRLGERRAEADRASARSCRARRRGPRSSGPGRSSARATPTAPGTGPT